MSDEPLIPVTAADTRADGSRIGDRPALDLVTALSALSIAVMALATGLWFAAGFAATDTDTAQLAQASGLGLGVSLLLAVPFGLVAWWAWRGHAKPLWTLFLMLPWVLMGAFWILVSDYDWFIGFVPAAVAALALLRAVAASRRRAPR